MSAELVAEVLRRCVAEAVEVDAQRIADFARDLAPNLTAPELLHIVSAATASVAGLGPLQPLRLEPGLTDILVNAPNQIWFDSGDGLTRSELQFVDVLALRAFADRLAAESGRRLDSAAPLLESVLPDGVRVHAAIPPVAVDGPILSLRFPSDAGITLADLVELGSITEPGVQLLREVIAARLSFLVTGGTGTGKTTVLGALLGECAPEQRLVIVEDTTELQPRHPHVVRLQARQPNSDGVGEITLRTLVRQALRMRPDRIVVGEVRGAEVVDLLAALNTGHAGSCGTVHANSPGRAIDRLVALGLMAGLPREAALALISAGLDAVIGLSWQDGRRVVAQLHVLCADELQLAATLAPDFAHGPAWPQLAERLCAGH